MKKIICLVVSMTLILTMVGCNNSENKIIELENKITELEQQDEEIKVKTLRVIAEECDILYFTPNRTYTEELRYKELTELVASLYPELVVGYDENGVPILSVHGTLQAYTSTLERELKGE